VKPSAAKNNKISLSNHSVTGTPWEAISLTMLSLRLSDDLRYFHGGVAGGY
jgi:hypothetical protein